MTIRRLAACLVPSALCLLAWAGDASAQGCGHCTTHGCGNLWHIDNCATIPRRAQPAPPGTYVNRWTHLQETKAELDDFVENLYLDESRDYVKRILVLADSYRQLYPNIG